MSDLAPSELQGLGASLVATPIAVIATCIAVQKIVGGDLGILVGSIAAAVVFLAMPYAVSTVFKGQPARARVSAHA